MTSQIKLKTKLVKPGFLLERKQEQKNIVDYIIDELRDVDIKSLKLDPEFLQFISTIIENQVSSKKATTETKPNKMDILVDCIQRLFPHITAEDIETSKRIVEFLLKQRLVKKTKLSKVMSYYIKKTFSLI